MVPARRPTASPLAIGLDAGATRTRAVVVDANGRILGRGEAGGANPHAIGVDRAAANLTRAATEALAAAGRMRREVTRFAVGAAGLGDAPTRAALGRIVASKWPRARVFVATDAEIALAAAARTVLGPAIAVIAGTGSIAIGRRADGGIERAGGHGFRIGDVGSATWIAREGAACVARALDDVGGAGAGAGGMRADRLTRAFHRHLDCDRDNFRVAAHRAAESPTTLGALARAVTDAAAAGDPEARRILDSAGVQLASLATAVLERLRRDGRRKSPSRSRERASYRVACFGGVF